MFLCRKKEAGREEVSGWLAKSAGQQIQSGVCSFVIGVILFRKKGAGREKVIG